MDKLATPAQIKKMEKVIDKVVEAAYYSTCSNIQISIWDISKVFDVGRKAYHEGKRGEELGDAIKEFVETIRKN
jgi:hypothetical protein